MIETAAAVERRELPVDHRVQCPDVSERLILVH
jgi:hypothetical protein